MLFGRDERTTRRGRGLLVVGAIEAHWPEDGAEFKGTGRKVATADSFEFVCECEWQRTLSARLVWG